MSLCKRCSFQPYRHQQCQTALLSAGWLFAHLFSMTSVGNLPLCSPFSLPFHISTFPLDLFPIICPSYTTATVHTKCPFHLECPRLAHYCSIPWLEIACLRASRAPYVAQASYTVPLAHQTGLCKPTQTFERLYKHLNVLQAPSKPQKHNYFKEHQQQQCLEQSSLADFRINLQLSTSAMINKGADIRTTEKHREILKMTLQTAVIFLLFLPSFFPSIAMLWSLFEQEYIPHKPSYKNTLL